MDNAMQCTGEIDRSIGMITHHGSNCPIHESLEGYRTEIKEESQVPVRYVTMEFLQGEKDTE